MFFLVVLFQASVIRFQTRYELKNILYYQKH